MTRRPAPTQTKVSPYDKSDQHSVRDISWRTADAGAPALWFRDREFLADILTGYYLAFEPEMCFVSIEDGAVTGYITGCADTSVFNKMMRLRVLPSACLSALLRGTFFRAWFLRLAAVNLSVFPVRSQVGQLFPAHLHINLLPENRGRNAGQELFDVLMENFKSKNVPGVHVSVREDNAGGIKFFKRNGFSQAGRHKFFRPNSGRFLYSLTMTKSL